MLPPDELASWAYIPPGELASQLVPWLHCRVVAALGAKAAGETWYLEYGVRAG